jgi:hypothetical protein
MAEQDTTQTKDRREKPETEETEKRLSFKALICGHVIPLRD